MLHMRCQPNSRTYIAHMFMATHELLHFHYRTTRWLSSWAKWTDPFNLANPSADSYIECAGSACFPTHRIPGVSGVPGLQPLLLLCCLDVPLLDELFLLSAACAASASGRLVCFRKAEIYFASFRRIHSGIFRGTTCDDGEIAAARCCIATYRSALRATPQPP